MRIWATLACVVALGLAGCADTAGNTGGSGAGTGAGRDLTLRYVPAVPTPENGAFVPVQGVDARSAFSEVQRRLRAAGFTIVSTDSRTEVINARATSLTNLASCGLVRIGRGADAVEFPVASPSAVIEAAAVGGGTTFVRQTFALDTRITVRLGRDEGNPDVATASITEAHSATMQVQQIIGGGPLYAQTIQFAGDTVARLDRGFECGSSRRARRLVTRP